MAMEIKSNPGDYFSVFGDLIWVVADIDKAADPVAYPNYKYMADVYIGTNLVARIKLAPRPDTLMGIFNLSNIIRNYVRAKFSPAAGQLRAQELGLNEFFINATIKFGEEYGFNTFTNVLVDEERKFFGHYNGRLLGQSTLLAAFTDKPATNRPQVIPVIRSAANCFLPYFSTSTESFALEAKSYDAAGNNLKTISQNLNASAAYNMQLFNVAPAVLNSISAAFLSDQTAYYTIKVNNVLYRLNVVCEPRYEVYTLHFLNKLGGFESRDFTKVSRKTMTVAKSDFGKLPYTVAADGSVSYYSSNNVYNETKSVYASQFTEKMLLNTDHLTDAEYAWLSELLTSPLIYLELDGYYVPCNITDTEYEFKKAVNDKLTSLTVNIEFGDQLNAQYR